MNNEVPERILVATHIIRDDGISIAFNKINEIIEYLNYQLSMSEVQEDSDPDAWMKKCQHDWRQDSLPNWIFCSKCHLTIRSIEKYRTDKYRPC